MTSASTLPLTLSIILFMLSPNRGYSQNYTKTLIDLSREYHDRITFVGIFPGTVYSEIELKEFHEKYQLTFPAYIDTDYSLTKTLVIDTTPTATLIYQDKLLYFGAIDNWASSLGKKRNIITQHYLKDAITDVIAKRVPSITRTTPIGCVFDIP